MKNKSLFSQLIILIIVAVVCILLTAGMALLFGSVETSLFDLRNLNISNMIPVIIIGVFLSCVVVGITVLFVSRNSFLKFKDYISDKKDGSNEK